MPVEDLRVVEAQLERRLRGRNAVVVRCDYGYPQVLRVHPVLDASPFPTTYWLTCPYLVVKISQLESQGMIARLEADMRGDAQLRRAVHEAHKRYRRTRNALLSNQERKAFEREGMLETLESRGIGGIADPAGIKCLHLHVAHELAQGNPIGLRVLTSLGARQCPANEVICSTLV